MSYIFNYIFSFSARLIGLAFLMENKNHEKDCITDREQKTPILLDNGIVKSWTVARIVK